MCAKTADRDGWSERARVRDKRHTVDDTEMFQCECDKKYKTFIRAFEPSNRMRCVLCLLNEVNKCHHFFSSIHPYTTIIVCHSTNAMHNNINRNFASNCHFQGFFHLMRTSKNDFNSTLNSIFNVKWMWPLQHCIRKKKNHFKF